LLIVVVVDRIEEKYDQAVKELDDAEEDASSLLSRANAAQAKVVRKRKEVKMLRKRFEEAVVHADSILMDEDIVREAAEAAAGFFVAGSSGQEQDQRLEVEIGSVDYEALLAQMDAQGSSDL
jgi:adenine-specific DNA methylase